MQIRQLQRTDITSVVEIHSARFPTQRTSLLGRPFLHRMYSWFSLYHPTFCLVAEEKGRVEGFIVGAIGGYGRRIFRFALPQIVWCLALRPQLLFNRSIYSLWKSYLRGLVPSIGVENGTPSPLVRLSLASLAVTESGGSAGLFLIAEMERRARQRGVHAITLSVRQDNPKVIRLYSKCGYTIDSQTPDSVHFQKIL